MRAVFLLVAFICGAAAFAQHPSYADRQQLLWNSVKEQLTGPESDKYFNEAVKDTVLPLLSGVVAAVPPEDGLVVRMAGSSEPEVTLILAGPAGNVRSRITPGTQIQFEGVAQTYTRQPFHVVFEVEAAQAPEPLLGALGSTWYFGAKDELKQGRFVGNGVQFDLHPGWSYCGSRALPQGELSVFKYDRIENAIAAVASPAGASAHGIGSRLEALVADTMSERADLARYMLRPESVRSISVAGHDGQQAIADYQINGQPMSEALTWIVTEHSGVVFFGRTTPNHIQELQTSLDLVVYSAVIR